MTLPQINVEQTLIIVFFVALGVQLFYYLFFYLRVVTTKPMAVPATFPPVSIVICARNEKANLERYLPLVFNQNYNEFEVIVVNDCSWDETEMFLAQYSQDEPRLKFRTIVEDPKFKHGKKLALALGIKAAQYDTIVLIDADCYPSSENWLKSMVQHYSQPKVEIVLGYGGYASERGILDKIIRFDTFFIGLNYLSFALAGMPYMGVGRNLSYSKALYEKSKSFSKHYHIMSGDDDLFVNENANKRNTAVEVSEIGVTKSIQKKSFIKWIEQKTRHLSTNKRYKNWQLLLLGVEPLSRVVLVISFVIYFCLHFTYLFYFVIGGFLLREILQFIVFKMAMNRLDERKLLLYSPLIDLILPIIYFTLGIKNFVSTKRKKWK